MAKDRMDIKIYQNIVDPLLSRLDSEKMHVRARRLLHYAAENPFGIGKLVLESFAFRDPRLHTEVEGIKFPNPVLVGAGWDKVGEAVTGLLALGFGGVEVGTVTEFTQVGNPKPRQFMVAHGVAVNRLGFNGPGMETVAQTLKKYRGRDLPIGISVGKNKDIPDADAPEAHARVVKRLYDCGQYFVINVSSPNTPGLRGLQSKKPLTDIVKAVQETMNECGMQKPLFVKIAPDMDLEAINDVIDVVETTGISGIIATNTTLNEDIKGKYQVTDSRLERYQSSGKGKRTRRTWAKEMGGLSGDDKDYRKISTAIVRHIYEEGRKRKMNITIIGVGGIKDAGTALEKIKAGASLVQVVTAIRGEGPSVARQINKGIVAEMERLGITNFEELIGYDVHHKKTN